MESDADRGEHAMRDAAQEPALRRRLEQVRDEAADLAARLLDDMRAVSDARDASNVDDEHDPEGSTIAFERSQLEAIRRSALDRRAEAKAALDRIDAGSYGVCLNCGRPIPPERLAARPMAALCLDCAS
jgi:DnaK suppressor protein